MRWICYNLLKEFFTCLCLLQSSTDNFFSTDPFKPSGSSSDSKKTTDSKDLSSSAKDPFSNPFGSDPFGEFTTIFFTLLPFKATVEPKLTNISSKRTLPSDPVTCLLHSSQGLVGNTEQARSARGVMGMSAERELEAIISDCNGTRLQEVNGCGLPGGRKILAPGRS